MYQSTPTGAQTVTHTLIDALNHTECTKSVGE